MSGVIGLILNVLCGMLRFFGGIDYYELDEYGESVGLYVYVGGVSEVIVQVTERFCRFLEIIDGILYFSMICFVLK